MPVKALKTFLNQNAIKYISIRHSSAYTAQEIAATAHISGKELVKTVLVELDNKLAMAVLPASYNVDFELLKQASGAVSANLAKEQSFKERFPDCELGAMPPFGNLYEMEVYVAVILSDDEFITFNAGNHRELIKLAYKDFKRLVNPIEIRFSMSIPCQPKRYAD